MEIGQLKALPKFSVLRKSSCFPQLHSYITGAPYCNIVYTQVCASEYMYVMLRLLRFALVCICT